MALCEDSCLNKSWKALSESFEREQNQEMGGGVYDKDLDEKTCL